MIDRHFRFIFKFLARKNLNTYQFALGDGTMNTCESGKADLGAGWRYNELIQL